MGILFFIIQWRKMPNFFVNAGTRSVNPVIRNFSLAEFTEISERFAFVLTLEQQKRGNPHPGLPLSISDSSG
jgi:hypothetical protein